MATYTAQTPSITGTTPTYSAVAATDTIHFTGDDCMLIVKNGGGGSTTVTVVVPGTKYGQNNPDISVTVPAAAERWIGPFKRDMVDASDGLIDVTYSPTTSVTAALVQL